MPRETAMAFPQTAHGWFTMAERGVLRVVMAAMGFILMVLGLGLGVTMVMLPPGLLLGFTGLGLFLWGVLGELPIDRSRAVRTRRPGDSRR